MATDICTRLGRRIRVLRDERGWTQQQLADMAVVSRQHLSDIESGKREAGLRVAERIAQALGKNLGDLLNECLR